MGVPGTSWVGLIPRVAQLLFHVIHNTPGRKISVETTYIEIYNEKLRDLLNSHSEWSLMLFLLLLLLCVGTRSHP